MVCTAQALAAAAALRIDDRWNRGGVLVSFGVVFRCFLDDERSCIAFEEI